jgi:hypothetical protein
MVDRGVDVLSQVAHGSRCTPKSSQNFDEAFCAGLSSCGEAWEIDGKPTSASPAVSMRFLWAGGALR